MRTVQVAIATAMLAVPASAFALSPSTSAAARPSSPASLPVRAAPRHVTLGQAVSVTGAGGRAAAGRRVELESASGAHSAWRRVATASIDRHGRFAFRTHPRHSGVLRAVEIGAPVAVAAAGSARTRTRATRDRAPAVSSQTAIEVAARLRVAARERAVLAGQRLQVAGRLLPARAGRRVALQGHSSNGWRTLAHARTGPHGGFAARLRAPAGSDRRLRVVFAGDRANGRAVGAAGDTTLFAPVLVSWYDDAGSTACGFHAGLGVANRTVPCGTRVQLRNGARTVTATVDDRGPYVGGRAYDLNQSTAAALGFAGVGTVDASVG